MKSNILYEKNWLWNIIIFFFSFILADPTSEEENLCTGIVSVVVTNNNLCLVHKPGGSPLSEKDLEYCINKTKNKVSLTKELINTALLNKGIR